MNVRQHSCGRGRRLGPEAPGVVPVRFFSVGRSVNTPVEFARTVVWQKPNPFAHHGLAINFSCGSKKQIPFI
jgi:hypothetical protein